MWIVWCWPYAYWACLPNAMECQTCIHVHVHINTTYMTFHSQMITVIYYIISTISFIDVSSTRKVSKGLLVSTVCGIQVIKSHRGTYGRIEGIMMQHKYSRLHLCHKGCHRVVARLSQGCSCTKIVTRLTILSMTVTTYPQPCDSLDNELTSDRLSVIHCRV